MDRSIRVWFLGVVAFCAVYLLCLQRHWGLIAPKPVGAAPAASVREVAAPPRPEPIQDTVDTLLTGTVIEFQTGSAALRPESLGVLGAIASTLQKHPEARVQIEGHTDASGSPEENQGLSERRAEAVKTVLVARGVDATRIETLGFGSSRPLVSERTPEDRARNRRIHLTVTR